MNIESVIKSLNVKIFLGLRNAELSEQYALDIYKACETKRKESIKNSIKPIISAIISISFYLAKTEYGYFASLDYKWLILTVVVFLISVTKISDALWNIKTYANYMKAVKKGYPQLELH